ncbi:18.1 kDa class I heat shock protein-like [Salvia hispanica]|uniref:18.1 kDa class I heat shock protein-like n=1 Tax=Salvia hispanica TaxID=49212 RepID=UPI00200942A8|nr:18.1 kDa class I heat shock protein-like [Salvia hispanica]
MSNLPIFPRSHLHHPSTMDMWDSFKDFHHRHEAILAQRPRLHGNTAPPLSGVRVEWSETPEAHVLRAELPGLKKEEVKVKVKEGKFLKISGKKKVEREDRHENWHHVERSKGKFSRVFTLPEDSKSDSVKSHFDNAILTITVPKRDAKKSLVVKDFEIKG